MKKIFLLCVFLLFFSSINCLSAIAKFDYDYSTENYNFNLPKSYSANINGFVTPVKIQGHSGPCWCFGIISALESNYLRQNNLKQNNLDFSEMNLIYNLNDGTSTNNPYAFDFDVSGNNEMATAYFASGRGPVFEKNDPYKSDYTPRAQIENLKKPLAKYIRRIIYVPDINQSDTVSLKNHRELVKKFVFENGSVATNIFWNENYLDKSGKNYYYNSYASATNHTAAIIGWDDNYSRENFEIKPEHDGAFILKNSWGADKHDNGFFFMSYDDKFAGFNAYFMSEIVEPLEKYKFENIYQHDYFGMTSAFREELLGDKKYICSVFDLKSDKESLSDIGVFIASNNVNCKFLLLKVNDDGEIVGYSDFLYEENFEFPGYYVVSLPKKILLSDKKFGIGVKMTGPDLFIPCEKKEYNFCSKAVAQPNQNFYGNEYGFENFNAYDITNFCIKGFTEKNLDSAQNISYKKFLSRPIQNTNYIAPTQNINHEVTEKKFANFDGFIIIIIFLPFAAVLISYLLSKKI